MDREYSDQTGRILTMKRDQALAQTEAKLTMKRMKGDEDPSQTEAKLTMKRMKLQKGACSLL